MHLRVLSMCGERTIEASALQRVYRNITKCVENKQREELAKASSHIVK